MKAPVILLLTHDSQLENSVADVLAESGGVSYLAHDAGEALQIICSRGRDLDFAVIDFAHGPHGMTLLAAINVCREDFPVVVITGDDQSHVEALAYVNGATACLPNPVTAKQLADAFCACRAPRHQLALVA